MLLSPGILPLADVPSSSSDVNGVALVLGTMVVTGLALLSWHKLRQLRHPGSGSVLSESSANTPAIILVQDFGPAVIQLEKLRAEGITNLGACLEASPSIAANLFEQCPLLDANLQAFHHLNAANLADFKSRYLHAYQSPWKEFFHSQLLMIWSHCSHMEDECVSPNPSGQPATWFMSSQAAIKDGQPNYRRNTLLALDVSLARSVLSSRLSVENGIGNILAQANTLIWWAKVRYEGNTFHWRVQTPVQSVYSPIYRLATAIQKGGLWDINEMPDAEQMTATSTDALKANAPGYQHEFRCLAPEGIHWLHEDVSIQQIAANEWNLVGVVSDITRRRLQEIEQNEEADRLRALLRIVPVGIVGIGATGHIEYLNRAAAEILEGTVKDCIGKNINGLATLSWPESQLTPALAIETLAGPGKPFRLPPLCLLTPRSGRSLPVEGILTTAPSTLGGNLHVVLTLADCSEENHNTDLRTNLRKLDAMTRLAGGVAHDFNNILSAIIGNLTLMQSDLGNTEDLRRSLSEALAASNKGRDLSVQMMSFARDNKPVTSAIDLPRLLNETGATVLRGSSVRLTIDAPADLNLVRGDRGQLQSALATLLGFALQNLPAGGAIRVSARNEGSPGLRPHPLLTPGHHVRIEISNTGPALPDSRLDTLFDPYSDPSDTHPRFAMACAHAAIHRHHGLVEARNEQGRGTVTTFWIPAMPNQAAPNQPDPGASAPVFPATPASPAAPVPSPAPARAPVPITGRVLFMDDEEPIQQLARRILQRAGLEVVIAREGQEALNLYAESMQQGRPFDAVIMDLTIPGGMGGRETIVKLLAMDPSAKAIVSSGYASDSGQGGGITEGGFLASITKPYEIKELSSTVRRIVEMPRK